MTFPAAALAALKPRERALLHLKALIGPAATGKTVFVECLNRVSSGGPGWSHATLAPTLQALRAQGLLTEDLTCAPELLHPLAVGDLLGRRRSHGRGDSRQIAAR